MACSDDSDRLDALRRDGQLDTPRERVLDDLTQLAATSCAAPVARISLVDAGQQWLERRVGPDLARTPQDLSFCSRAITDGSFFEVADTAQDPRSAAMPYVVGSPRVRSYAGVILRADAGHAFGTLSVFDVVPRALTAEQRQALELVARLVVGEFELSLSRRAEQARCLQLVADRTRDLAARERLARSTVDALTTHVAILDETGRIVAVNDAWRHGPDGPDGPPSSKGAADEGANYLAVCDAAVGADSAEAARVAAGIRAVLAGRERLFSLEYPCHSPTGKHWFALRVTQLAGDGPVRVVAAHEEVTERKLAEIAQEALQAQLRQAQKLEAVGTLAGGIAHDFNNILGAVIGNAEAGLDDPEAKPPVQEMFRDILQAGHRARELVRGILTFSRQSPPVRQRAELPTLVHEAVRLLRATLPASVEVRIELDIDTPPVLVDVNQIQQLLMNLATNSFQALGGSPGWIRIAVARGDADDLRMLGVGSAQGPVEACARLTVSDSGGGIDASVAERIFEPFFTTKSVDEGTGLGLSIVHGIVQSHGGTITLQTHRPEGAAFRILLPATTAHAAVSLAPPRVATPGGGRQILLIDDEPALLRVSKRLLEKRGFRVSAHGRPEPALAAFRSDPMGFAMVLADYNLPGRSGLDVARDLLALRPDLPVLILSGYLPADTQAALLAAGVREVLQKPVTVQRLDDALARV